MKLASSIILALFFGTLAGCSSASTRKVVPLDSFKRIYVERRLNDNDHLDEFLAAELRRTGREASSGPLTMMPENTDALLTYDARWQWDFKTYLIDLKIELFTARTHKKLADADYYQPSIKPKPPADVTRDVIDRMFGK